ALYTIGFTRKPLRRFVELVREAGVDLVVDVRLRNTGQLAGWAKRDDLAYILEILGIEYRHRPELAPTPALLTRYRRDHDWVAYEAEFGELMRERGGIAVVGAILAAARRPCLMCSEADPARCHRRLVAEQLAATYRALKVVHLV